MSYKINQSDGTLLVDLIDGKIDVATTDVTLVGRNYTGYGEAFNENFVKMLENFASTVQPTNPLRGQIWYDTSVGRLKVYDGTEFRGTDTTTYAALQPSMVAGDLWVNATDKQLYFSDGSQIFRAGPTYTRTQGQTECDAITLTDSNGFSKTVARWTVGGNLVAIVASEDFTAPVIDANVALIPGFPTQIKAGVNINPTYSTFAWNGTATNANNLIDTANNVYAASDFLRVSPNLDVTTYQTTNQHLHINNDRGLLIGDVSRLSVSTDTTSLNRDIIMRAFRDNANIKIQTSVNGSPDDAITIDTSNRRVGIFNAEPAAMLHIGTSDSAVDDTSIIIEGNLTVRGDSSSLDVSTLRVEDKQIELAITDGSTLLTNAQVDDGGVVLRASGEEKKWTWKDATDSWTASTNIDVADGRVYKINNTTVLSINELHNSVTQATGLVRVGTLEELTVDNISLNASTITTTTGLNLNVNGDIQLTSTSKIRNIAEPALDNDAATKIYVDDSTKSTDIWLSVDSTGLTDAQIAALINDLVPASTKNNGVSARVHCTEYSGEYTYNPTGSVSKSFVAVDSAGVQNQSVIGDFSFTNTTDTVTLTVTRTLKRFEVVVGSWAWQENLSSSV